jgi:CRP-like cAMP-binding protein
LAIRNNRVVRPNGLLATLDARERDRLAPFFEDVELPLRKVLTTAGELISHAWFPHEAVASTLIELPEGDSVELGLVGADGFVGLDLLLGASTATSTVLCQAEGHCARIATDDFRREIVLHDGALFRLLLRYSRTFLGSVAQSGACNASHALEQRFARWLLMMQDRVQSDRFPLTHEFAALMLAVRRASVTQAANGLRLAGAIEYERGEMHVLDRDALLKLSCGCYGIMTDLTDWTFADSGGGRGRLGREKT